MTAYAQKIARVIDSDRRGVTLYWWQMPKTTLANQIAVFGNVDLKQVNLAFQVSSQIESMEVNEGSFCSSCSEAGVFSFNNNNT